MTGGVAVVLGTIGANFGAGMTGGMAYIYDPNETAIELLNMDSLVTCRVGVSFWEEQLYALIQMHYKETSSQKAEEILQDWDTEKSKFLQICPNEMLDKLSHPLSSESDAIPAE